MDQIQLSLQITVQELTQTLFKCKNQSPGPDNILYNFIQNPTKHTQHKIGRAHV